MATNPRRFQVTELDFDDIKSNLKTFLKSQTEFTDYNFEGSGMNILLDTLAYNTHYLAYNVNMAMNESFLDSALLRSSVVSHAKTLGYTPRSARAPVAYVNVTLNDSSVTTATMHKGTVFKTSVNDINYTFVTNSDYTAIKQNGILSFTNIPIYEGTLITTKYTVDITNVDQKFKLVTNKADSNTLKVSVQTSLSDNTEVVYFLSNDISEVSATSPSYFLQESQDGIFEVYFGDGVVGQKLSDGNIVVLEYVVTNNTDANGASVFSSPGDIGGVSNITVTTVSLANGGTDPETIESIRYNAPLDFSSQGRAVTASDYKIIIPTIYADTRAIQVWGGEDNDPPQYGQVFVSIKTESGINLTQSQKETIVLQLKKYNIASVRPTIIDPETTFIELKTYFKYNSKVTTKTQADLETLIRTTITNYNNSDLKKFDGVFRFSKLSRLIDNTDVSILSNVSNVKIIKNLNPLLNETSDQYVINFSNKIYHPHDGHNSSMGGVTSSTGFKINGNTNVMYFDDDGFGNIRMFYYISGSTRNYVNSTIGSIDYNNGKVTIFSLNVSETINTDNTISLTVIPNSLDVVPVRNQLIEIDLSKTTIIGEIDTIVSGGSTAGTDYTTATFYS
jgi:hypothetical protein